MKGKLFYCPKAREVWYVNMFLISILALFHSYKNNFQIHTQQFVNKFRQVNTIVVIVKKVLSKYTKVVVVVLLCNMVMHAKNHSFLTEQSCPVSYANCKNLLLILPLYGKCHIYINFLIEVNTCLSYLLGSFHLYKIHFMPYGEYD